MTEPEKVKAPQGRNWGRFVLRSLLMLIAAGGLVLLGRSIQPPAPAQESSLEPTLLALSTQLAEARWTPESNPTGAGGLSPTEEASHRVSLPSPEGFIIFTSFQEGHQHLRLTTPGSLTSIALTSGPFDDSDPALSHDGRKVAFRSNRNGNWDLYTLELGTGEIQRLTDTQGYEGHPTWSPDGRWLAYEAYQDGDLDIWILPLEQGKQPIQLTNHPALDSSPSWDPEGGRQIAFLSNREGSTDIFMANLDLPTDRFRNITNTPDWDERHPAISPEGDRLAYVTYENGLELVWTRQIDQFGQIPQQIGAGTAPQWSPSADALVVIQSSPHNQRAVVYDLGGQSPPVGIAQSGPPIQVSWGPEGSVDVVTADNLEPQPLALLPTHASSGGLGRRSLIDLESVESIDAKLIEEAQAPFEQLRAAIAARAGWDFLGSLEAAFVGLNDPLPPGFAYNDWLYTGRAFAFDSNAVRAGWVAVVPEEFGGKMYWRVYVRTSSQDGSQGSPIHVRVWDFNARYSGNPTDYDLGGELKAETPEGYFVDFTSLAEAYGFHRQPALTNWRTFYPGARFNEFAYTEGLDWRTAMLQLYPAEAIATPTVFSSPTPTPTNTPWPTPTPWWLRWRTPTPIPSPTPPPPTPMTGP